MGSQVSRKRGSQYLLNLTVHKFVPKLRWIRLDYLNTYIILTWLGWLSVGINSSLLAYFTFGFLSQFYLRRYRPVLFSQWLLTVTAAIGGGKWPSLLLSCYPNIHPPD